jgi:dTDP-4-dehydrorhamnose reductase
MRILVTGARGQLGHALLEVLAGRGHETVGVDLGDGDLAEPGVASRLLATHRPEQVIHAAAYTAVDAAESARAEAERGNATATRFLADACDAAGLALTALSTDYVFDGTVADGYAEDAPREPINWYGETKARAEDAVLTMTGPSRVVRTSWLFGHGPDNFVRTMLRLLDERETLRVVDDQRGSPTYTVDLAALLADLVATPGEGVFHGTNAGVVTWCGFAREIARAAGHDPARITACGSDEFPTPARRPACSVLRDTRLAALGVAPRPSWQDALARFLDREGAREERGRS